MDNHVKRILTDYDLLCKIIQLVLVCICMSIMTECEENTIPTWLWIMYSINTVTYSIILLVLSLAHIFDKKKSVMAFTYFLLGIILYLIAGISGIIRYNAIFPIEKRTCDEKTVGIILIICSILMAFDICIKIRLEKKLEARAIVISVQ